MKKMLVVLMVMVQMIMVGCVEDISSTQKVEVARIITETVEDFYIEDGEIGVDFTDGSWISANLKTNKYVFQPVDLGDWCYEVDSLEKLEMLVKTYLENKNNN